MAKEKKSSYRQEYEAQLKAGMEAGEPGMNPVTDRAGAVRKTGGKKTSEKKAATKKAAPLSDQEKIDSALAALNNIDEDSEMRASLLFRASTTLLERQDLVEKALAILEDPQESLTLRKSIFNLLQASSFKTTKFAPYRAKYLETLRSLVAEEDLELREDAIEVLAQNKDEYVQRRLLEGLKKPNQALVAPEKAIQLLGYDIHAEYYPLLREIAKDPPSAESRIEAIRLLAADSESKELLVGLMKDKKQETETRNFSSMAVKTLAPTEFNDFAKATVMNDKENDEVRAMCLNALSLQARIQPTEDDDEFEEKVQKLQEKSKSENLKKASMSYIDAKKAPKD